MDLYYIDYISVSNKSWLHRAPVWLKMMVLIAIIGVLLYFESLRLELAICAAVLIIALTARIPMKVFLLLAAYPVVFLAIIFLSIDRLTLAAVALLGFRVLAITASVILFILSTSYPEIFGTLGRILPDFLVAALFFTYRSIFIISDSITNIQIAMHLRGGSDWRHPVKTLRNFGFALGHFLVHSIESSQRMADSLKIRGFSNRIYYLGGGK